METKTEKDVRYLKIYAVSSTLLFAVVLFSAFTFVGNKKFTEIDVERINIVEKDGSLKLVISNKERQHPGTIDGITYNERKGQRPAGMIFFSSKGDEIGGLVYDGDAGKGQGGSLTFDRFRGDQTVQFLHSEEPDGRYFAGLKMNDQNMPLTQFMKKMAEIDRLPTREERNAAKKKFQDEEGPTSNNRLQIGRGLDKSSFIELKDANGRARIEISVQADGNPKLNFYDDKGEIIYSLPDKK